MFGLCDTHKLLVHSDEQYMSLSSNQIHLYDHSVLDSAGPVLVFSFISNISWYSDTLLWDIALHFRNISRILEPNHCKESKWHLFFASFCLFYFGFMHDSALRDHTWWAWGTNILGCGDQNWVDLMKGKNPTHCTIFSSFLVIHPPLPSTIFC